MDADGWQSGTDPALRSIAGGFIVMAAVVGGLRAAPRVFGLGVWPSARRARGLRRSCRGVKIRWV